MHSVILRHQEQIVTQDDFDTLDAAVSHAQGIVAGRGSLMPLPECCEGVDFTWSFGPLTMTIEETS